MVVKDQMGRCFFYNNIRPYDCAREAGTIMVNPGQILMESQMEWC